MDSIILASHSPRRREILEKVRIPYLPFGVEVEETIRRRRGARSTNVRSSVIGNAGRKAEAAKESFSNGLVLGVDTVVFFNGQVLGKPADGREAFKFLKMLSGNWHSVYSGITVRDARGDGGYSSCSVTRVRFSPMSRGEIESCLERGEWVGKAGGYAVQGEAALYIDRIEGSFYNIMGLPLEELYRILKRFDYFASSGRYEPRAKPKA
jgi:septum formation protein